MHQSNNLQPLDITVFFRVRSDRSISATMPIPDDRGLFTFEMRVHVHSRYIRLSEKLTNKATRRGEASLSYLTGANDLGAIARKRSPDRPTLPIQTKTRSVRVCSKLVKQRKYSGSSRMRHCFRNSDRILSLGLALERTMNSFSQVGLRRAAAAANKAASASPKLAIGHGTVVIA